MVFQDFPMARKRMVEDQLKGRDIVDKRVLKTMAIIPREVFVPKPLKNQAYFDGPLPIGQGQTISQPYIVALMTQLLKLKGEEKVLEIGTGSGYQSAILSKLAREVYTIERHPELLKKAGQVFERLGLKNVKTKQGDGSKGWLGYAPYDGIMVTAAASSVPKELTEQLAEGGRLVVPIGSGFWQRLVRLTKKKNRLVEEDFGGCAFVPLVEGSNR